MNLLGANYMIEATNLRRGKEAPLADKQEIILDLLQLIFITIMFFGKTRIDSDYICFVEMDH